ncbi:hypothetical protein M434DRAFT_379127 [Hypoxylon sp. CO27-5]|nr:hypothetical protein M434DRAFT_379127 [Hypoxylon sp. CO27-5]
MAKKTKRSDERPMGSTTGVYQGLIKDATDYERVKKEYTSRYDLALKAVTDFPENAEQQRGLIKVMLEAAQDCSCIYELPDSQSLQRIQSRAYSDLEWELMLWPLLTSARSAQEGRCRLARYVDCKAPPYNPYESFMDRFNAIVDALRTSKAVVMSCFRDATFIDRLAWRPRNELRSKAANRKLNNKRDEDNAIGVLVASRDGIKPDENGLLVDQNGQVYGSTKKRSAMLDDTLAKSKKRGRPSAGDSLVSSVIVTSHQTPEDTKDTLADSNQSSSPADPTPIAQNYLGPVVAPSTTTPSILFNPVGTQQRFADFYYQQGTNQNPITNQYPTAPQNN